jgi:pimeloyl-ACP methyl ester carboxylesterase
MPEKKLTLPRMGETMSEGTIVAWLKQPGQHFRRGETLLEVESDKINVEIPALEDGEMVLHLALAGEKVTVDYPIAVVHTLELSSPPSKAGESQPTLQANVAPPAKIQGNEDRPVPAAVAKIRASPAARRAAREMGVNLPEIKGTGPRGRVTGTDVRRHASLVAKPATSTVGASSGQCLRWGKPQRGTCVLLHGFAGEPTTWRRTGEFLAEQGFEATAFELPGHGLLPLMGRSLEELVVAMISRLPNPSNGKSHLIGHSLGGAVAIQIAAQDPGRVDSLTLLAPIGIGTYINQSFLDGIISASTIEALERELRKTTARPISYAKSALAGMLESQRAAALKAISQMIALDGVQQLFLVPELEKITAPVRVFFGRQDKILNWQDALSLPGKIALHLFDTGHMPHWEDPSEVLPVLGRFPV